MLDLLEPHDVRANLVLAWVLKASGTGHDKMRRALEMAMRDLHHHGSIQDDDMVTDPRLYDELAACYAAEGRDDMALQCLTHILGRIPNLTAEARAAYTQRAAACLPPGDRAAFLAQLDGES